MMNRLCTQTNHGIHIMETFRPISHLVPGNKCQIVGEKILLPVVQSSDNNVPNLQNLQYQEVPVVKSTASVSGGYENAYANNSTEHYPLTPNDQYSITTNFTNTRIILNNGEYLIKNSIANTGNSSELLILNGNPCSVLFTSSTNHETSNNATSNDKYQTCKNQGKTTEKPNSTASAKSSKPSTAKRVKTGVDTKEKLGNLHIHVSESFMPWNVKNTLSFDLNFMRNLFDITNVDIIFPRDCVFESGVFESVRQIVINNILSDWLILKCEARQIPFYKVNNQIEIFSINSFSGLVHTIVQESCLPLPYITRASNKVTKFFFLNFPKDSNDKIPKLNAPIFHDAEIDKELACKYPGIRTDTLFEPGVKCFTIHVHKSAMHTVQFWLPEIRRSLIYNHIIWGFLQAWIRRLRDNCNNCFKVEDIARNLSLFQKEQSDLSDLESDRSNAYFIGYKNYYLKFDTVALKGKRMSFSIENFETEFVSNVPIIQYYRQYFLINDVHYSDALKNILHYTDKTANVKELVYVPIDTVFKRNRSGPSHSENTSNKSDASLGNINQTQAQNVQAHNVNARNIQTHNIQTHNIQTHNVQTHNVQTHNIQTHNIQTHNVQTHNVQTHNVQTHNIQNQEMQMNKKRMNATNQPPNLSKHKEHETKRANHNKTDLNAINKCNQIQNKVLSNESQQKTKNSEPKKELLKPLLKTRTVEEINSSVDLLKSIMEPEQFQVECKYVQTVEKEKSEPHHFHDFLNNCYTKNFFEISSFDESKDPIVRLQRFDEAVAEACDIRIIDTFIEKVYCKLQINFTNATCQSLLNRKLPKLLAEKFPDLNNEMSSKNKLNEFNQTNVQKNTTTKKTSSQIEWKEKDAPSVIPANILNKNNDKSIESSEIKISSEKSSTHPQIAPSTCKVEKDETVQIEEININGSPTNKFLVNEEFAKIPNEGRQAVIVENIPQIVNEVPIQVNDLPGISQENKNGENSSSFAIKEQFLKMKYNIKPCSVILDRQDITNYIKLRKHYGKKREHPDNDVDDDDFSPKSTHGKRLKKISDLEIVEAKARVLQRLRKRNEMYINSYNCEKLYTSEKLEPFLICRNFVRSMPKMTKKKKRKSSEAKKVGRLQEKAETSKMKHLQEECKKKELRVLLTRVEELPEYETYKLKSKIGKDEIGNDSPGTDNLKITEKDTNLQEKYEKISNIKDGYFEVRSGRLYLKENYNVKNGVIVPVEKSPEKIIPKKEPEGNFICDYIKQEIQN